MPICSEREGISPKIRMFFFFTPFVWMRLDVSAVIDRTEKPIHIPRFSFGKVFVSINFGDVSFFNTLYILCRTF